MLETILDYWRGASLFVASCNLICETIVWNVNMHIWKNNYFGCNITCYFLCSSYDCYCQPQRHYFLWYSSLSLPQTNAYYSSLWNHYSLVWVPPPIYIYLVLKVMYADWSWTPCDGNPNHATDVSHAKEWDSPSVSQESF